MIKKSKKTIIVEKRYCDFCGKELPNSWYNCESCGSMYCRGCKIDEPYGCQKCKDLFVEEKLAADELKRKVDLILEERNRLDREYDELYDKHSDLVDELRKKVRKYYDTT